MRLFSQPPDAMRTARLIVCEKTGTWAVALRRSMGRPPIKICETRSLSQCWEELDASPASLVALELTAANLKPVLQRLVSLGTDYPRAAAVVLGHHSLRTCAWLLREAGAVHVLFTPRRISAVQRLARRQLEAAAAEEPDVVEAIWERLPWGP